jgi:septum formation topological specificity factor MinE
VQLQELIFAVNFVNDALSDNRLVDLYDQLYSLLSQARQQTSETISEQIKETREEILDFHSNLASQPQSILRTRLLDRLNVTDLLGKGGIERVNRIFSDYAIDPGGASIQFQELSQETQALYTQMNTLKKGLGGLVEDTNDEVLREGEGKLTLVFQGEATIENLGDLEKYTDEWLKTLRAFSQLVEASAEDPRIISIEKGSLILELAAACAVVIAVARGVKEILEVFEKYLEIRKKALEIRHMKLSNNKAAEMLEEEAEKTLQDRAKKVAAELVKEHLKNSKDKGDVRNNISLSLERVFVFVEKGGQIDFYLEPESGNEEAVAQIESGFNRVRQLEQRIEELKALEAPSND